MFDLNKPAVGCARGKDATEVLQHYMQSKGVMMVHSSHPVAAVDIPTGTGAVDPNPLKR